MHRHRHLEHKNKDNGEILEIKTMKIETVITLWKELQDHNRTKEVGNVQADLCVDLSTGNHTLLSRRPSFFCFGVCGSL